MARSIGMMREELAIVQPTETTDSHGGRSVTWSTLDTVYAELQPMGAIERLQAQAIQAVVNYRFRVRVRTDLTTDMRALWRPSWSALSTPKTLEIHGLPPDPNEPQTYMLLECGEVVS